MTSLTRRTVLSLSAAMLALPVAARAAPTHVTLFKNPQCDCCEGYVVEGHVPVAAIHKLLAEQPPIMAITLPRMPEGSPGMGGRKQAALTVYAVAADGVASVYLTE